ncbi:MAG: thiol:disulfide interchange protein DsbA/DsbL [Pseudomonadota bacterium]|nr:thiol:disulfide interchange protein DsbA/DsbL [Pseudomonadota bacterium]
MRFVKQWWTGLCLGLVIGVAAASPSAPKNGVEYRTLTPTQNVEPGKKVEVTEFFWYSCPHCAALEPALAEWVHKQGDRIIFKRVPVHFRDSFVPQQKLYYALDAMGKSEEMQRKIFNAIHVDRQRLDDDTDIIEFVTKNGIDKQKFTDLFNAFGTQAKVRRALGLQEAYKIDGVPSIAVDGKWVTSPSQAGSTLGQQPEAAQGVAAVQVLDVLVARAEVDRKGSATAATAPVKMAPPVKEAVKK